MSKEKLSERLKRLETEKQKEKEASMPIAVFIDDIDGLMCPHQESNLD